MFVWSHKVSILGPCVPGLILDVENKIIVHFLPLLSLAEAKWQICMDGPKAHDIYCILSVLYALVTALYCMLFRCAVCVHVIYYFFSYTSIF